jgi:hypothetical protein
VPKGSCLSNPSKNTTIVRSGSLLRDTVPGFADKILGVCWLRHKCEAVIAPGFNGGNSLDQGLSKLGEMVGQLLQQLMQGGKGGESGASSGTSPYPTGCQGGYYNVPTPSSDPCARYTPGASGQLDTSLPNSSISDSLLNALQGSSGGTPGGGTTVTNNNTNTNTNANANTTPGTTVHVINPASSTMGNGSVALTPRGGASGDIALTQGGATVYGGTTDVQSNTTVAGFYGSDTFGNQQPTGIVSGLCRSRPWATNFLSVIIPPSFFDGLCTWRGYQVGTPPPATPTLQQTPVAHTTPKAATTTPVIPPKVTIWAVPAKVPLDTRTTIFWTSQGVTNCTETSPDGSFSQNSVSGGAATVPITGATTFSISCMTPEGTPVSDYVTVNLSI